MEKVPKNPIDKDKVAESPGLLEYAHHVGSALIRPEDKGKLKGRSLAAMYEQTDLQIQQIKRQIEVLVEEAKRIDDRKRISEKIYETGLSFQPVIGHIYHVYEKEDGSSKVSMLSPDDWGRTKPNWTHISKVKLLGDHTWQILDDA
ncbi:MAG: DUF2452 domain-containing protein [Flavobacteriales bacterium]|jgi:hypothetical protein|nr:DUF2452 domain-containing protein [Flavobacteriales bacterium]